MKFIVPEDIGNSLRVLPSDTYTTQIQDVIFGESSAKKPKCTIIHIVTSEYSGTKDADFQTCIGEKIIDTVSLQPQAMFRINDYYKAATGERIPANPEGYEKEEFETLIKEALIGAELNCLVDTDSSQGDERSKISKISAFKKGSNKPFTSSAGTQSSGKKLKR